MKFLTATISLIILMFSCTTETTPSKDETQRGTNFQEVQEQATPALTKTEQIIELFTKHPEFIADGFDYPVGKPNAKGYYNAQGFAGTTHLGDDWNAVTGGNSDLGDPIYAVANGYVNFAEDLAGGWGNVIRVWH